MYRTRFILSSFLVVALFTGFTLGGDAPATQPASPDFSGIYFNSQLSIQLVDMGEHTYAGSIETRQGLRQQFVFRAKVDGGELHGTFKSRDNDFTFTAAFAGDELVLQTGGTTYHLKNFHPANNPPKSGNIVGKWSVKGDLGGEQFTLTLAANGDVSFTSSLDNVGSGPTFHYADNKLTFNSSITMNQFSLGGTWNLKWVNEDEFTTTTTDGKTLTLHRIAAAK